MKKFYKLFYIFVISSVCGYFIELIWTFVTRGIFVNHSAVAIGPFNFAYGICAVALTLLLEKYKDESYLKIFILSFIGGSVLEYIMSYGMEVVVGFTAWDYSHRFLNINGRICLLYSIFWGILGIVWIKGLYPRLDKVFSKAKEKIYKPATICVTLFLIFDIIFTVSAVSRAHNADKGIPPQNGYQRFLDHTFNSKYLKNMFNNNWK